MTSLRGVWGSHLITKPSTCNLFQGTAMKLNRLLEQNVGSNHFYCSSKSICCRKSIQTIGQRRFPLQEHSGLNHDRVYITRHTNCSRTIQSWNSNMTQQLYMQTYQIVIIVEKEL